MVKQSDLCSSDEYAYYVVVFMNENCNLAQFAL